MRTRALILFATLFVIWLMLTGRWEGASLVLGLGISALILALTWRVLFLALGPGERRSRRSPVLRVLAALLCLPRFLLDMLGASLQVARLALAPRRELRPGIVRVTSTLRTKMGLVVLANQVTITPGTLTLDVDGKRGTLYVHCLDLSPGGEERLVREIRRAERGLRRVME